LKIWERHTTLFGICLGLVSVLLIVYALYLGIGTWLCIEGFKNNVFPAILERNQEIEKILELLP